MFASAFSIRPLLGATGELDHKFVGIQDAALMGLRVPYTVVIDGWSEDFNACERSASEVLAHFAALKFGSEDFPGVCLRFGDKYHLPKLPPSICFIGAEKPELRRECADQTRHFVETLGLDWDDNFMRTAEHWLAGILSLVAQYVRIHGLSSIQGLVQIALDTLTGDNSGYGVAYTRHQTTGEDVDIGRYMWGVSGYAFNVRHIGSPSKRWLTQLPEEAPDTYGQLLTFMRTIELYYGQIRFLEFAVVRGAVWILQITRRREKHYPTGPLLRLVSDEWRGAPLPLEEWMSSEHYAKHDSLNYQGLTAHLFFDDVSPAGLLYSFLSSHQANATQGEWEVFLNASQAPSIDYSGGVPIAMSRHNETPIVGRRYSSGTTEVIQFPTLKSMITISNRRVCLVENHSKAAIAYAVSRLLACN